MRWMVMLKNRIVEEIAEGIPNKRVERLQKIYVGKGREEVISLYLSRLGRMIAIFLVGTLCCLTAVLLFGRGESRLEQGNRIKRNVPEGQEEVVHLEAEVGGDKKEVDLTVHPRAYTEEQRAAKFAEAREYLKRHYLGENTSADRVDSPLSLVTEVPDSAVSVDWQLDANGLIQSDGSIAGSSLEKETPVEITAVLSYGEITESVPFELTLLPPKQSEEDKRWKDWSTRQKELDRQTGEKQYLSLPETVDGKPVSYQEPQNTYWYLWIVVGILGIPVLVLLSDSRIRQQVEDREKELRRDYPEMLEQFVLLVGAGMTVKGAWLRITSEYCSQRQRNFCERRYVYEEMLVAVREMENGMSESRAYEMFGKRTGILSYMKFSTLLVQNLRKGSADLLHLLEYEAVDAFRVRKEQAKTRGEEASTKLLLPMMLMLLIVFVMILYAAFRSM